MVNRYYPLIRGTAEFMADFAEQDSTGRYILRGIIPAQETLRAAETVNPPSNWPTGTSPSTPPSSGASARVSPAWRNGTKS